MSVYDKRRGCMYVCVCVGVCSVWVFVYCVIPVYACVLCMSGLVCVSVCVYFWVVCMCKFVCVKQMVL